METCRRLTGAIANRNGFFRLVLAAMPMFLVTALFLVAAASGAGLVASSYNQYQALGTPHFITRISTDSNGVEANNARSSVNCSADGTCWGGGDGSSTPSVSDNGRFVAFSSSASNLVPNDTNGDFDLFVKDLQTGLIIRASTNAQGQEANGESGGVISADGSHVAFSSSASNLVPNDTNGVSDIFVKDLRTGNIIRVSTDAQGSEANRGPKDWHDYAVGSFSPAFSADAHYVAFVSSASNLVLGDTNENLDVFIKDMHTGAIARASTNWRGEETNGFIEGRPGLSADGRLVAFASNAANLVFGDNSYGYKIIVKDLQTGSIVRADANAQGRPANSWLNYQPSISADGRFIVFESSASNLVPSDTNDCRDIFVKDLRTGSIVRASTNSQGSEAHGIKDYWDPDSDEDWAGVSMNPGPRLRSVISDDGRYVAFDHEAYDLVPGDTNKSNDVFIKDLLTGAIRRVSMTEAGDEGKWGGGWPDISTDGRYVALVSSNLVAGDDNGVSDVFLVDTQAPQFDATPPTTKDNAPSGWQRNNVNVTLSCRDALSGCASTDYTLNGIQESGNSVLINREGDNELIYHSTDIAGNVEAEHTGHVYIDKTTPQVTYEGPKGYVFKNRITISGAYADPGPSSGVTVSSAKANISGRENVSCSAKDGGVSCSAYNLPNGHYEVTIYVTDNAGNTGSAPGSFDKLALPEDLEQRIPVLGALPLVGVSMIGSRW